MPESRAVAGKAVCKSPFGLGSSFHSTREIKMSEPKPDPVPFERPDEHNVPRDQQKGAQQHAEGMQGPKARAHFLNQLHSGKPDQTKVDHSHEPDGTHRLFESREQHDTADRASEKNRLDRDIREHQHNRENFQAKGGSASSRAMPRNPVNPGEPDAPTPGEPQPPAPQRVPGVGGS